MKKLSAPEKMSSRPFQPDRTSSAEVTPFRAGMPAKTNAFSMWSVSRCQARMPEDCCAEGPGDAVRAQAALVAERGAAHGHDHARADVVAERHGTKEARTVDAEF